MGISGKITIAAQDNAGRAKGGIGAATDDTELEFEGKKDQAAAAVRSEGEDVKDAINRAAARLD